MPFYRAFRPLRRSRARFPFLSPTVTSSPGAGEVFPQRESQAVTFVAKVLGIMRKLPAVHLALPLGELSPQVTERAHAVNSVAKVSIAMRNLPAMPKAPSPRGLASRSRLGEFSPAQSLFSTFPPSKVKNPAEKRSRWFKKQFGCVILEAKVPAGRGNRRA